MNAAHTPPPPAPRRGMDWDTLLPPALLQQYVAAVTEFTRAVDAVTATSSGQGAHNAMPVCGAAVGRVPAPSGDVSVYDALSQMMDSFQRVGSQDLLFRDDTGTLACCVSPVSWGKDPAQACRLFFSMQMRRAGTTVTA